MSRKADATGRLRDSKNGGRSFISLTVEGKFELANAKPAVINSSATLHVCR